MFSSFLIVYIFAKTSSNEQTHKVGKAHMSTDCRYHHLVARNLYNCFIIKAGPLHGLLKPYGGKTFLDLNKFVFLCGSSTTEKPHGRCIRKFMTAYVNALFQTAMGWHCIMCFTFLCLFKSTVYALKPSCSLAASPEEAFQRVRTLLVCYIRAGPA